MGSSESKTAPEPEAKKIDSDNFTVVQVHLPTFGLVIFVLVLVLGIISAIVCYYRQHRRFRRSRIQLPTFTPSAPYQPSYESQPFPALAPQFRSAPAALTHQQPSPTNPNQIQIQLDPHVLAAVFNRTQRPQRPQHEEQVELEDIGPAEDDWDAVSQSRHHV